jgi:hypothetical protein
MLKSVSYCFVLGLTRTEDTVVNWALAFPDSCRLMASHRVHPQGQVTPPPWHMSIVKSPLFLSPLTWVFWYFPFCQGNRQQHWNQLLHPYLTEHCLSWLRNRLSQLNSHPANWARVWPCFNVHRISPCLHRWDAIGAPKREYYILGQFSLSSYLRQSQYHNQYCLMGKNLAQMPSHVRELESQPLWLRGGEKTSQLTTKQHEIICTKS